MTPGYSPAEKAALESSSSLSAIADNPVNGPHKLVQFLLVNLNESITAARFASVLFGLLFLGCFYIILRRWFGRMVAIYGTVLFTTLPFVILTARSASSDVMYLGSTCLVAAYIWLSVARTKSMALLALTGSAALLMYTPGMIWFILAGALLWHKKIYSNAASAGRLFNALGIIVLLAGAVPIAAAALSDTSVVKRLFLLPSEMPSVTTALLNTVWGILGLVWQTRDTHPLILGHLPILSAAAIVLTIFGLYVMWKRARSEFLGLMSLFIIGLFGYSLNRELSMLALTLPAVGVLMAAGLRYLYAEWRAVFPLNPLPKFLAMLLVASLVLLNMMFGIRYSLDAWPNSVTTKNTYVIK